MSDNENSKETVLFYKQVLNTKDEKLVSQLEKVTSYIRYEKGEMIVFSGEKKKTIEFLDMGIFRGFFIDDRGKEITDCFGFKRGTPIVSTFEIGQPSPIFIEAVETCGAYSVPIKEIQALMTKSLKATLVYNQILQTALKKQWDTKMALYQYSAQQKYEWFLEEYAEIANRVSNKNIASFLNITPVTLSRLKGNMKRETQEGLINKERGESK